MKTEVKRMPDSVGLTIRVPNEVMVEMRKARSVIEENENRTVSLNEVIIRALTKFTTLEETACVR
ncbi:MAG: hypothetical protein LBU77_00020 [Clostridiales bacterium]|jgi:hypothetical protein|nr:hypothetical protein [Clostridiales bacterium]